MQTSIRAGDRVRCALWGGDSLLDGAIYLLYRKPAGIIFRRIRFDGDEVLLTAENPEVSDRSIEIDNWTQSFRPIAQVLECVRPL
jgi:SOS-response transcriptional repressor LexA